MDWHRGTATIGMAVLDVRAALAHRNKSESFKHAANLRRFKNRDVAHDSSNPDGLRADKLAFEFRLAIFEQHGDDLAEVGLQLVERLSLRVCAGKPGHITDEQTRV